MQKQIWVYLTPDDEASLLGRLSERASLRVVRGRFFKGDIATLRTAADLETADLRKGEHWTHLLHPTATQQLVAHPMTDGPYAGWSRLDEVRSEVLSIVRPDADAQGLAPARLVANSHAWFGGDKLRKGPAFSAWLAEAMSLVEQLCPRTQFDWIRVAPGAEAFARAGGRLHYLYREVKLAPAAATEASTPHRRSLASTKG